jgi:catechol 2,3-dioxygenase-like lactoylglutathione lyase family enzyme
MKTLGFAAILTLCLVAAAAGRAPVAQLAAPNDNGVSMGHIHLTAHDVDGMRKFFVALGGTSRQNGRLIQFPGVFIMVSQGEPTGGTAGSIVNHIGFKVRNMAEARARWLAAGLTSEKGSNYFVAPGGVRIEMNEDKAIAHPMEFFHVHFWVDSPPDVQAWYSKTLGATPGRRAAGDSLMYVGDVPGANLTFSDVIKMGKPAGFEPPMAPTKRRALDHIGFEVRNLDAFCKKLEAQGVKFDRPYQRVNNPTNSPTAVAFLTDPWGTYIELTENLAPPSQ